jgi:hypothetical protein
LQICASVKPVNPAPLTVKLALSPGRRPSLTSPPAKVPLTPVTKPKSRTLANPGTAPRSASENEKFEDSEGACMPVNPFSPEALALPSGGRSNPIPVMVDVLPGSVIADVFVIVKVNVFVWLLNSHTVVAVDDWPDDTPTMSMVSARTVDAGQLATSAAVSTAMTMARARAVGSNKTFLTCPPLVSGAPWRRPHDGGKEGPAARCRRCYGRS